MLTEYQKSVIIDMAVDDFDCGHPMSDFDEALACMKEDSLLADVAEEAANFYLGITANGAPSFRDDYIETSSTLDDNDWDEDDDLLYGEDGD